MNKRAIKKERKKKRAFQKLFFGHAAAVHGKSMNPTFDPKPTERVLVEKLSLDRYNFSRGDVVVLRSPSDHRDLNVKRLIALPGDWIQVPEKQEIRQIPEGHCWVEGDNAGVSWDSREYGPVRHFSVLLCPYEFGT
ncbi:hypothetical protein PR202_gb27476 [Eleusine coracana subsp. coracana]|uniref:Mitochondrial inner membrane protease subunit 2 n=1 Tax=Eleusine coracana subsp. coracana TaxID=191504 RepID=A0AAV5FUJ9_ELECO|nr:hypothetical protein PR202_gb27476 [Eleusine coracana subsp. coracana]